MDNKRKIFKFKYSTLVWVLLAVVGVLAISGLVWNIYALLETAMLTTIKIISHSLLILLTLLLCVFALSVAVYGRYVLTNKYFIQYFGLIKTKTPLDEIVQVTHFKKSNKLVAYFKDEKYTVIVIDPCFYSDFIIALRELNPSVVYDVQIDGEDTPE